MLHCTIKNSGHGLPQTRKVRYGYALLRPDPDVWPRPACHKQDGNSPAWRACRLIPRNTRALPSVLA